jgi:hypothetical protein
MTYQVPHESGDAGRDPRRVLLEDLKAQPDVNRHIAIAWARLAGRGRASAPNRVTVLKPFAL